MKDKISKKRQRKNRENKYFEWSMKREVDNWMRNKNKNLKN
jgi:hypothetical protein